MDYRRRKTLYVATRHQLNDPQYYKRLWLAARNLSLPRREWLDAIADAIRDYEGEIAWYSGEPYEVPCIDKVFGDDPDVRWLSYFLGANDNGDRPLRQTKKIERLRLIDLYFRIEYPEIAKHFHR